MVITMKTINISASRGAAILGFSKWKTQAQTVLEIIEQRNPGFCEKNKYELTEFEYNSAMKWGHAFESAIIELAESKTGYKIIDRERLYIYLDFMTCHIDGKYESYPLGLHEGKTTTAFNFNENFGEPGTDQVPIEYQIQCQHQMICTGAEKVILSVLVFPKRVEEWEEMGYQIEGPDSCDYKIISPDLSLNVYPESWARVLDQMGFFHQYEITANPELQKLMIEKYTDIWNNYILKEKVPEPKTYNDIKMLITEPTGTIVADEEMERLVSVYKNIKSEISSSGDLAKQAEMLKVQILKYMSDQGGVIDEDSSNKFIYHTFAAQ